jgi:hypothetical protein
LFAGRPIENVSRRDRASRHVLRPLGQNYRTPKQIQAILELTFLQRNAG